MKSWRDKAGAVDRAFMRTVYRAGVIGLALLAIGGWIEGCPAPIGAGGESPAPAHEAREGR